MPMDNTLELKEAEQTIEIPHGMLDRDQRTTLTVSDHSTCPLRRQNKNITHYAAHNSRTMNFNSQSDRKLQQQKSSQQLSQVTSSYPDAAISESSVVSLPNGKQTPSFSYTYLNQINVSAIPVLNNERPNATQLHHNVILRQEEEPVDNNSIECYKENLIISNIPLSTVVRKTVTDQHKKKEKCCRKVMDNDKNVASNMHKSFSHISEEKTNPSLLGVKNRTKMTKKSKSFAKNLNNLNKKKPNSFLICILICLSVLVQKTYSKPVTMNGNSKHDHSHHQMEQQQTNNGETISNKCNRTLELINNIRRQAMVAYDEINGKQLDSFVSNMFNLTHDEQHNEFKQTHFLWLYPEGYPNKGKLPYDNYTQPISVEELHHLRNKESNRKLLENELIELFKRMNLIALIAKKIENVIEKDRNARGKYGSPRNHRSVRNYFETQAKMADDVIKEVEFAFRQLGLQKPEINQLIDVSEQELQNEALHWVVTREHLKLLNYVRSAFQHIIVKDCLQN